jgi:Ca2+-binding RTX toxin-like protein
MLIGDAGNDTLDGGGGVDTLAGGAGDDVYKFAVGGGADTIVDTSGNDRIVFGADIPAFGVTASHVGSQLKLSVSATDSVSFAETSPGQYAVESVAFADGTVWQAADIRQKANSAPAGSLTISGTATENQTLTVTSTLADADGLGTLGYQWQSSADGATWSNIAGATGASLTLGNAQLGKRLHAVASYTDGHGTAERVVSAAMATVAPLGLSIIGTAGADNLVGTAGSDTLDGLGGNDTLNGGGGHDVYVFGRGYGADLIRDELISSQTWVSSGYWASNGSGYWEWDDYAEEDVWVDTGTYWVDTSHLQTEIGDGGADTLRLGAGIRAADLELKLSASDLMIGLRTSAQAGATATSLTDRVTLQNFDDPKYRIESVEFADGSRYAISNFSVGGSGNDGLTAAVGGSLLWGGGGSDILTGSESADHLDGGSGNDLLVGGGGNDIYAFAVGGGADSIVDSSGTDQLMFGPGIVASGVTASRTGSQVTLSVSATDSVTFDETAPGQYAVETVSFADGTVWHTADIGPRVSAAGAGSNLSLIGTTGSDTLNGLSGNDILIGGAGNDTLLGGGGNDMYMFGRGYGADLIRDEQVTSQTWVTSGYWGSDGYWAYDEEDNEYWCSTGPDYWVDASHWVTQTADGGSDTLRFGAGISLGDLEFEKQGADLVIGLRTTAQVGAAASSLADRVTLKEFDDPKCRIEFIGFADGSRYATSNWSIGGAHSLTADSGGGWLWGSAGSDLMVGGTGADRMAGGAGDDWYFVNNVGDQVVENVGEGYDRVVSGISYALSANVEFLYLETGASNATGNELDNEIYGNEATNVLRGGAGDDILAGGEGADFMAGGTGNDTYVVDNAGDAIQEAAGGGIDTVLAHISYTLGSQLENLTLEEVGPINGTGNTLDNVITGNSNNNVLDGGAGVDTLYGGGGNDVYAFGRGYGADAIRDEVVYQVQVSSGYWASSGSGYWAWDDDFCEDVWVDTGTYWVDTSHSESQIADAGSDTLRLGAGIGLADLELEKSAADLMIGLRTSAQAGASAASLADRVTLQNFADAKYRIESIEFADGSHYATGNWKVGGGGNDALTAAAGGGGLWGAGGNDTLTGSAAADRLDGGAGNDTLAGGAGSDTYVFGRGYGTDLVQDNDATAGNTDVAQFLGGIAADQIWLRHVGNNLEANIIGTADKLTFENWYLGSSYHVEQFKTSDNKVLLDSRVDTLVQAMASFAPPAMGQTTLQPVYQAALAPVIAANWQ